MKRILLVALVAVFVLALLAAPALAADTGAGGAGEFFGGHVAEHAMTGHFEAEMNPGMHQGFSGFRGGGEH